MSKLPQISILIEKSITQKPCHGREGEDEFHHGLTMDESETSYWSFSEQQWFPLTMNESGDFYWDYPHQTWSRFK